MQSLTFFSSCEEMLTLLDVALCGEPSLDRPGIFSAATQKGFMKQAIVTAIDTEDPQLRSHFKAADASLPNNLLFKQT